MGREPYRPSTHVAVAVTRSFLRIPALLASAGLHLSLLVAAAVISRPGGAEVAHEKAPLPVALVGRGPVGLHQPVAAAAPPPVAATNRSASRSPAPRRRPVRGGPRPLRALASSEEAPNAPGSPAPSAGEGTGTVERDRVLSRYLEAVLAPITAHTSYPEEAERLGLQGRFVVRIAVDRHGRVLEASLVGAEPHVLLKRSAFAALAASAPLPPPPPELGSLVRVDVPFVYRLDG